MKKKTAVWIAIGVTAITGLLLQNLGAVSKKIERRIVTDYGIADEQFARSMGSLLGPPLVAGNRVEDLQNGVEIFPSMLGAIRGAERTITFETYIYWSGSIGREFADALSERARAGVKVHVLLDWVGSGKMEADLLDDMRSAGIEIEKYHPPRWYTLSKMTNRTHRKLLVVDGRIGFTGGVGIADVWQGNADSPEHWRDSHYRLEGPAVAQMQSAFIDNWLQVRAEVLHGNDYFPPLASVGRAHAQVFNSSPRGGTENVGLMYLLSIAAARESIRIASAYFVPDDLSVETLVAAARRGIPVEILLPGPIMDVKIVQKASRSRWGELLEAGIAIYEYQPTMLHCKVMVVDELWTSVGSTNFDNRSFRLNDETNLNVFDREFAREQSRIFDADKQLATRVTLDQWHSRPFYERVSERVTGLLRQQL